MRLANGTKKYANRDVSILFAKYNLRFCRSCVVLSLKSHVFCKERFGKPAKEVKPFSEPIID